MSSRGDSHCLLCAAPVESGATRRLCTICDEYTQHLALQTNQRLERIVGQVQNGVMFRAASRRMH